MSRAASHVDPARRTEGPSVSVRPSPAVMFSVGDPSADACVAAVARSISARCPGARLYGLGGSRMREAGVDVTFDLLGFSSVGVLESLGNAPALYRALRAAARSMDANPPDCLLLADMPGFNMRLAETAHRAGVRTAYLFCPTAWAWGGWRARRLAATVDRCLCVFDFEAACYRTAGATVEFVGHPVLDWLRPVGKAAARRALGIPEEGLVIGLFPGSRAHEVTALLPIMLDAARMIAADLGRVTFVVGLAPSIPMSLFERVRARAEGSRMGGQRRPGAAGVGVPEPAVSVFQGVTSQVMEASDAAVVKSGTSTLEAAVLGLPMVIIYRVSRLSFAFARRVVRTPWVGLPNVIAGAEVVPELIQDQATALNVARCLLPMVTDANRLAATRSALGRVTARLGSAGATERIADAVLGVAGLSRKRG